MRLLWPIERLQYNLLSVIIVLVFIFHRNPPLPRTVFRDRRFGTGTLGGFSRDSSPAAAAIITRTRN